MKKLDTLYNLLEKLEKNDTDEPLNDDDFAQLADDLKSKVDAIKDFITRCEYEADRLQNEYIKPIQARKKAIENSVDNLKQWILRTMENHNLPLLHGELFTLMLQERTTIEVDNFEVTQMFYVEHKEICERIFELNKKAIKDQLEKGQSFEFARMKKKRNVMFKVKKGEKKK